MNSLKLTLAGALAGLTLAGCATTASVTGPTVVSYDHGALDTLLELTPATVPASVQPVVRGERTFYPVKAETLAEMAPDTLLVVDRSAAVGAEPLKPEILEAAMADAGADTDVVVLNPGLWYLSGGGLQSVRLQVDEVVNAVR